MKISKQRCKNNLAIVWFAGSFLLLAFMIFETYFRFSGEASGTMWGWFLPTVMPTLSLITGVLVTDSIGQGVDVKTIDRFLYLITMALSLFYLSLVALPFVLACFKNVGAKESIVPFFTQSNVWLGPVQGLASAALGVIYIKKE